MRSGFGVVWLTFVAYVVVEVGHVRRSFVSIGNERLPSFGALYFDVVPLHTKAQLNALPLHQVAHLSNNNTFSVNNRKKEKTRERERERERDICRRDLPKHAAYQQRT